MKVCFSNALLTSRDLAKGKSQSGLQNAETTVLPLSPVYCGACSQWDGIGRHTGGGCITRVGVWYACVGVGL